VISQKRYDKGALPVWPIFVREKEGEVGEEIEGIPGEGGGGGNPK
jgi:hypothetical protein